jgi:hypothetical protein
MWHYNLLSAFCVYKILIHSSKLDKRNSFLHERATALFTEKEEEGRTSKEATSLSTSPHQEDPCKIHLGGCHETSEIINLKQ